MKMRGNRDFDRAAAALSEAREILGCEVVEGVRMQGIAWFRMARRDRGALCRSAGLDGAAVEMKWSSVDLGGRLAILGAAKRAQRWAVGANALLIKGVE